MSLQVQFLFVARHTIAATTEEGPSRFDCNRRLNKDYENLADILATFSPSPLASP